METRQRLFAPLCTFWSSYCLCCCQDAEDEKRIKWSYMEQEKNCKWLCEACCVQGRCKDGRYIGRQQGMGGGWLIKEFLSTEGNKQTVIKKSSRGIPNIHINKCEFPQRACSDACSSSVSIFQNRTGMLCKLRLFHTGAAMLTSPPLVSDNFLNEAHYVFIDFSYSLLWSKYPPGTPLPLCPPPHLQLLFLILSLYLHHLSIYPSRFLLLLPKDYKTAEHLREANGFQLAK